MVSCPRDPTLRSRLGCHEQARFGYRDHNGRLTERATEQLQLVRSGHRRWYLVAWDLEREAWRTFRVDRIAAPVETGRRVPAREFAGDVTTYVTDAISRAPFLVQAEFVLTGTLAELQPRVEGWIGVLRPMRGRRCLFSTGADSVEGVLCHLLLIGAPFELRKPRALQPELAAAVKRLALSV
ncbi:MAG: WYL domain-containing protein [Sandaracinaceae bacterium]|nr:WYL domain-containing protein [Sandaracinaceae bacterium]